MRKTNEKQEHKMWIVVSRLRTCNLPMPSTLSNSKKDAIKKSIEHIINHFDKPKEHRYYKQTIQKTWKEMRINNSYSVQKISLTTIFNI